MDQINQLNRHYAAIVESSDDAIISKNLNGIIQSWNKGAERIFGYTAEEVIGKSVTILIPEGRLDEEPAIIGRIRAGERIDHYETIRKRKDGTLLNISITVSPIKNDAGQIIGASKIGRDITEAKKAAEEIRQAKDALAKANEDLEDRVRIRTASLQEAVAQMEEFSYTVSHDLRGPVRAMQGYALAVLEDAGAALDERSREYLGRVVRGSKRMDKLIHDVLIYSKLVKNHVNLHHVSLNQLVREIIQQYPEMQSPHAEFIIEKPLASVWAHESSLSQAVSNLLHNAKKFVAPKITPKIEIFTERREANVRLWIKDNGIGIKPEYHSRLFGMFVRANHGDTYEGTGIGLAIVRKTVEKMGGTVGLESDGTSGSSFWIELPSAD
ncbi:MAG TPA: PAS domain S-box protein [Verrucomicrobiae bacterium]|jgi:PAS domain S-box-containing protein|nr:PAS domain S-box protein [Verrucomicrobiae bacterium]